MEATQTQAPTKSKPAQAKGSQLDQSVYIADQDLVKTYPLTASNDEIDFDLHTTVRNKTPEDYYVNFLPLKDIQSGWKAIEINAPEILGLVKKAVSKSPAGQVVEGVASALDYESKTVDPALKLAVADPAYAFGFSKETSPEALADTYKPWLELWRESQFGKSATEYSDKALLNNNPIPWFFAEFMPDQLLTFGTKASSWVGNYGIEKFGPPVINKAIQSKFNQRGTKFVSDLLKKIFKADKDLASEFQTLGIKVNSRTSDVVAARNSAAKVLRPDLNQNIDEWNKVNDAYQKIMGTRKQWMDNLFDLFRTQETEAVAKAPKGLKALLADQRGSAIIPTRGDLVKVGSEFGKVLDITGQIALVNLAGKTVSVALDKVTVVPKKQESAVNTENLSIGRKSKENLEEATSILGKDLENQKGKPLKHEEVIEKAKEAEIITQGVSRESTLAFQASLLKTRQHLAALAEENELTQEFLDTLKVMSNLGTDIARNLESFKIEAVPEFAETKVKIIKDLIKLGKSSEEILKAAKGVDFKDEQSVAKFYRKFVKPTLPELMDEFVYMNILSSPITHITNAFSNIIQMAGLNPLTKLASGTLDYVASGLKGKERQHYVSEVPAFYKGALNAVPEALKGALDAMKGKKNLERPDVKHLPTLSKLVDWGTLKVGKYVIRALEASDIFFRTMIQAGEVEALSKALGHAPNEKEMVTIQKEATKRADYYVFRQKPDASNDTGQGKLLSAIDQMTNGIYAIRRVPTMKWFIRFVQTPMNILKQGIEYSPAGFATMPGAKDKTEQAGKSIIGSMVFAGAAWLAAIGRTTWSAPTNEKEKNDFYAAGLQPYSVKVGDKWVSYSKIGPLSYPLAMASALHYFTKESPKALSDSEMDKVVDAMFGILGFFSDQSYMQNIGELVKTLKGGEKSKVIASIPSQLIPLSSLQGWVNNIIDPLQRKAEKGLTINSIVDNIQMKVIGMSQFVPAQIDSEEVPVKKQMRGVNAVSPLRVSKVDQGKLADYKENQQMKQEINLLKKESKE